jgi:hypothetical protein
VKITLWLEDNFDPSPKRGVAVPAEAVQKITPLTEADWQRLQKQSALVENFLADDRSRKKFQTAAGKLGTIRAILGANVFQANQKYELQCLGIVLGDAFVLELSMEWVMVEDEYGRDPALKLPGSSIILYPLTMISRRIERGEKVEIFEFFNSVLAQIAQIKPQGV